MSDITIRNILPTDNAPLATIVRNALSEFGANKPGTVFFDPTTDHLFELFQHPGAAYFVALLNGSTVGGAGIFPSAGLPGQTCELVKMYLAPAARGLGLASRLMQQCFAEAKAQNYTSIYLETLPELSNAVKVYERFGFTYLNGPLGNTGHFGCNIWMLKNL